MKDKRDYRDFLVDILNAIKDIDDFIEESTFESFISNREKVYATIYCLQVIGEAVKNIPKEIRGKYQEIPWRQIAGMRDRLSHGYFVVDFERVWETITRDLSTLKQVITKILKEQNE